MKHVHRISLQVLGFVFVLIGIIGLFLPILQGFLFIIMGLYILTVTSPAFKTRFDIFITRFPKVKPHVDRGQERMHNFFKRFKKHDNS
jgi:uncharacterized membrane protein YbaN (DUF454 family)